MIIILTQCFPPRIGGIENVMSTLANSLSEQGESVVVITDCKGEIEKEDCFDQNQKYAIYRYGGLKFFRNKKKIKTFKRLYRKFPIEAIFTDTWKSIEGLGPVLIDLPVPVFSFAHGNEVLPLPDDPRKEKRIRKALALATKVISVSQATSKLVTHYVPSPEKNCVIYNPVPFPQNISDLPESLRHIVFENKGDPTLLTLGRIEPRKGHDQVIRSLPALKNRFPHIKYWIAGSGHDQVRLKALAKELNVLDYVKFWGTVDEKMKSLLLENATLMVMPNRHDHQGRSIEGYGLVFVEAAYHCLPVVAGDSGGANEAVIDGETGVLCQGDDQISVQKALFDCLESPDRMQQLAAQGYRLSKDRHAPENAVTRYKSLWR